MKYLLSLLLILVCITAFSQEIKVIQINAEWNHENTIPNLDQLEGCEYQFLWLRHQPINVQNSLSSVPVLLILKEDKLIEKYEAGIRLKLDMPFDKIQQTIYAIKED